MDTNPSGAAERRPARNEPKPDKPVTTLQVVPAAPAVPVKDLAGQALSELVQFESYVQEDKNEGKIFGDMPEHCSCPHCDRSVITFIDHEASWVTWVLGFVVWFSLGWMAFWVLPLLWPAFKDVVHHCPRCLNVIARKSRINLPTFRTEIMSFKIGNCAVVLARKYVMILLFLVLTILGVYVLRSTVHLNTAHEVHKGAASMLTWEDFLFDCGPRTSLGHRASTAHMFEERYRRRSFKWQGEVKMIREGFDVLFVRTKSVIMVTMYPHRYPKRDLPDVALLFGEDHNKEVSMLNPGDWVEFEATMTAHGYRGDPEVMTLWHMAPIPRPDVLSSSAGAKGHDDEDDEHHVSADGVHATASVVSKEELPRIRQGEREGKPDVVPKEVRKGVQDSKPAAASEARKGARESRPDPSEVPKGAPDSTPDGAPSEAPKAVPESPSDGAPSEAPKSEPAGEAAPPVSDVKEASAAEDPAGAKDVPEGDAPKGDVPESDEPKGDAPKAEGDAPKGEAPEGDAPKAKGDEPEGTPVQ